SLAKITVPITAFSSGNFIIAKLPGATNTFGGAPPGISPTFFLPDGHYDVTSDLGTHSWGAFDVSARAVTATHGAFKPDATNGLAADACKLGHVTFGWPSN